MARKPKGISAAGWFYQQSFVSSGYTENELTTDTAYKAMERLNNAVGYLQTLPEFTAEAQNILADARKRVAAANLRRTAKEEKLDRAWEDLGHTLREMGKE